MAKKRGNKGGLQKQIDALVELNVYKTKVIAELEDNLGTAIAVLQSGGTYEDYINLTTKKEVK